MNEYGKSKTLEEILQDLVHYCFLSGVDNPLIKVKLPKSVLERFSMKYAPIPSVVEATPSGKISRLYLHGGVVELES